MESTPSIVCIVQIHRSCDVEIFKIQVEQLRGVGDCERGEIGLQPMLQGYISPPNPKDIQEGIAILSNPIFVRPLLSVNDGLLVQPKALPKTGMGGEAPYGLRIVIRNTKYTSNI